MNKKPPALPLKRQVSLLFFLLVFIPLVLIYCFLYVQAHGFLQRDFTQNTLQTLRQMSLNIDNRLASVLDTSSYLARNTELYRILQSDPEDLETQISDTGRLRSILESASVNDNIYRIRLFLNSQQPYTRDRYNIFPMADAADLPWYAALDADSHFISWQETYPVRYPLNHDAYVISLVRVLRDPSHYDRVLGLLVQDIRQSTLQAVLDSAQIPELISIHLVSEAGHILSAPDTDILGTAHPYTQELAALPKEQLSGEIQMNGSSILYTRLASTGWLIAGVFCRPGALHGILNSAIGSWFLPVSALLLAFSLCAYLSLRLFARYINQKSKELLSSVSTLELDGLPALAGPDSHFGTLEQSIGGLILSVRDLLEKTYQDRLRAKDIELRLLQAQINPHFLYNALDVIYWKALQYNAQDVAQQISTLSRYFRLTLHKGEDIVSIGDEIQLINAYLSLQKGRFGSRFTARLDVPPALHAYRIPKLTLQPLVENALLHGILKQNASGHVDIVMWQSNGQITCRIQDDGIGMPAEKVRCLLDPLASPEEVSGYGLYSVNKRLMLFFGDAHGLHIHSKIGEGTTVSFTIPQQTAN